MSRIYAVPYYPVGTILEYDREMNMTSIFGGTWELYAVGRSTVCIDKNDPDFNTVGKVGGSKEVTLTQDQMPKHYHSANGVNSGAQSKPLAGRYPFAITQDTEPNWPIPKGMIDPVGNNQPHNNMPPYVVVYRYRKVED